MEQAQKFCADCGTAISPKAEICPHCGIRQAAAAQGKFSKVALVLLTFFLGGLGAHKLYLRKYVQAVLYLLLFWTGIPAIIAFIEFIIYLVTSEEDLARKYGVPSTAALVAAIIVPFVGIALIGILAAIAIPQFAAYRNKAFNSAAQSDLRNCATAAEYYFAENARYPQSLGAEFECTPGNNVTVYYIPIGDSDYQLISLHANGSKAFSMKGSNPSITDWDKTSAEAELMAVTVDEQRGGLLLVR